MPPQAQQNTDENGPLWLTVFGMIVIMVAWYFLHQPLAYFILKMRYYELLLFQDLVPSLKPLTQELKAFTYEQAGNLKFFQLSSISSVVGSYTRYPFILGLLALAGFLYFGNAVTRFRSTYTMQRLAEEEQVDWPQIAPVIKLDLINTPLDEMPWAMALNPLQFAKKYRLLIIEKIAPDADDLSGNYKLNVKLKRTEAKQIFLMQLGGYWRTAEELPDHVKALFAMFAAKAHGDKDAVTKLNNQIAISAAQGGAINFAGTEALLNKYGQAKEIKEVTSRHAFIYTVMAAMLEFARLDGVYASADFLWLKPVDRRLWYTLNSVGRKTPFAEVAGIFSHYNAETLYRQPIFVPMVDEAVDALEIAIGEYIHKPED